MGRIWISFLLFWPLVVISAASSFSFASFHSKHTHTPFLHPLHLTNTCRSLSPAHCTSTTHCLRCLSTPAHGLYAVPAPPAASLTEPSVLSHTRSAHSGLHTSHVCAPSDGLFLTPFFCHKLPLPFQPHSPQ